MAPSVTQTTPSLPSSVLPVYTVSATPQATPLDWPIRATPAEEKPIKAQRRHQAAARPSCTHVVMDRIFNTPLACQICNRVPSVGWIYVCQQDKHAASNSPIPKPRKKLLRPKKRSIAEELKSLGFSKSIIAAAEQGHYTAEELDVLKQRKTHLREVIEAAMKDDEVLKSKQGPAADILAEKLAKLQPEPEERKQTLMVDDITRSAPKPISWSKPAQPCNFHVCHTCRPFSRDRSYASFETAFGDEATVPAWDPTVMPVASTELLARLDWNPDTKARRLSNTDSDTDSLLSTSALSRPRSTLSSHGFRRSLEESYHALVRDGDSSEITYEQKKHDTSQAEFDLQLWKKMMQGIQAIASATRLPGRDSEDSITPTFDDGRQIDEGHVEAVALMEGAVETKSPDIILGV